MAIAASEKRRNEGFDATKIFTVVGETKNAVCLACNVKVPNESQYVHARFWAPRSMINDHRFITKRIHEVESDYPFVGTKVIWPKE